MKPSEALARNIRARRGLMGLSQEDLAGSMKRLGFAWTDTTVSQVEGQRRRVTTDELVALSLVLCSRLTQMLVPREPEPLDYGSAGSIGVRGLLPWATGRWIPLLSWDEEGNPVLSFSEGHAFTPEEGEQ